MWCIQINAATKIKGLKGSSEMKYCILSAIRRVADCFVKQLQTIRMKDFSFPVKRYFNSNNSHDISEQLLWQLLRNETKKELVNTIVHVKHRMNITILTSNLNIIYFTGEKKPVAQLMKRFCLKCPFPPFFCHFEMFEDQYNPNSKIEKLCKQ